MQSTVSEADGYSGPPHVIIIGAGESRVFLGRLLMVESDNIRGKRAFYRSRLEKG